MHTPFMDKSPHGRHARGSAGGRLRQRLAHILTRSTCTTNTKSAAATAATSATAFVSLFAKTTADDSSSSHHHHHQEAEAPPSPYFCTPCTYERPKVDGGGRPRRRRSRSASLVHISVDCTGGAGAASGRRSVHSDAPLLLQSQHRSVPARDVRRTRQSKGAGGRGTGKPAAARSPPSASRRHHHCSSSSTASSWGRARRPYSWSSSASSTATDDELAPSSGSGSGGEEADTGTLFSSLSLSSDSTSEFYHTIGNGGGRGSSAADTRRGHRHHRNTAARRHAPRRALPRASDPPAPPPPEAFRPLVSVEEASRHGECGERKKEAEKGINTKKPMDEEGTGAGMAVVKRSSNPYLDFRSSMVEMVVERRIGSVGRMEELLGSYLSLNSPRHHPAILAAFEDVWEAVFGEE